MKAKKPISDAVRREIEVRAYLIWEGEGRPHGCERAHWARAEAEILSPKLEKKTVPAKPSGKATTNGTAKTLVAAKAKKASKAKTSKATHPQK